MNYLDLLPDDLIETINKKLIEAQIKERRKIRKEKKRLAKQHKICEKLLEKAYCKYDNISDFEFYIGGELPYIKISFNDSRFNEFVTIIIFDKFVF
jgi:hypothetical protein